MLIEATDINAVCPFCFDWMLDESHNVDAAGYFFKCPSCHRETPHCQNLESALSHIVRVESVAAVDHLIGEIDASDIARVIKELRARGGADAKLALILEMEIQRAYARIDSGALI